MSISYHGIVGYGKATLPSVEGGLGSMNILRDPPKSIHTRRIDKVGSTSLITDMVDQSGDRTCEEIQVYSRGVNPMVSVDYSNSGLNGGLSGHMTDMSSRTQAYLPYTIGSSFRPPVLRDQNLMPLSRQPRIWTYAFTNPEFPDFSKKIRSCDPDSKTVKAEPLRTCVRPTAVFNIERPIVEPFEIHYMVKDPLKVEANSGYRTLDYSTQHVGIPTKEINTEFRVSNVSTNLSATNYLNNEMNTDRYISPRTPIQNIHTQAIIPQYGTPLNMPPEVVNNIKENVPIMTYNTPLDNSNRANQNWIHMPKELERNLPAHTAYVNSGREGYTRDSGDTNRDYHLNWKPTLGGYEGRGTRPITERTQMYKDEIITGKNLLSKRVMEQFHGRYANNPYEIRA